MTTTFLFPILLSAIGVQALLGILIVTSLLGATVTLFFRIETTGVDLDNVADPELPVRDRVSKMA